MDKPLIMNIKAVVLLSGGLDSVYNLYVAQQKWPEQVLALTLNYGQKAWLSEKKTVKSLCDHLKVPVQILDISSVFENDPSSLTSDIHHIPTAEVNIENEEASKNSARLVWVSNRNGVLLNVAACVAEKLGSSYIIPGFNAEEAATFPDNSVEYIEKMNACLKLSTSNGVQIQCFSQSMNKNEIAQGLIDLGGDLHNLWSCYFSGDQPCGECESCQRFHRAKKAIGAL